MHRVGYVRIFKLRSRSNNLNLKFFKKIALKFESRYTCGWTAHGHTTHNPNLELVLRSLVSWTNQ